MTWEYLNTGDKQGAGIDTAVDGSRQTLYADTGASALHDAVDIDWDLDDPIIPRIDPIERYDKAVREPLTLLARGQQIAQLLQEFYQDERFALFRTGNIALLHRSLDYYYGRLLANPYSDDTQSFPKDQLNPEAAAAHLAAMSLLGHDPIPAMSGFFGFGSQGRYQNIQAAADYLLGNLLLIGCPEGARGLPDRYFTGFTGQELRDHNLGHTGFRRTPATLAVLAADVIHDEDNHLLPVGKGANQRRLAEAQRNVRGVEALERYTGELASGLVIQRRKQLRKDRKLVDSDEERQNALAARQRIETAVSNAAQRFYGYNPADKRRLPIMAECLVADAHDFDNAPPHIRQALARRMWRAGGKSKVRSLADLPPGARDIYRKCIAQYGAR